MIIELPWPPSVNRYLRRAGKVMHTTNEAKQYRKDVGWLCANAPRFGSKRLALEVAAYPPDKRRRDLDNIQKVLIDALMHAGLFDDDSQIDSLLTLRKEVRKPGCVLVKIWEGSL
jgi:crossover junction endodeoxyribonuclease RusA